MAVEIKCFKCDEVVFILERGSKYKRNAIVMCEQCMNGTTKPKAKSAYTEFGDIFSDLFGKTHR